MGKELVKDYTFSAVGGTVTFDALVNLEQDAILMITNVSDGIIIYNFADPAKGGTVATNVLTLAWDVSLMSGSDVLEIWYWVDGLILKVRAHSSDSTIIYMGKAEAGTATSASRWQIKEVTKSGKDVDINFSGGITNFNSIFDNREALSYS